MTDKEENKMVQKDLHEAYTLDEEAIQKIINLRPVKVKETGITNDIFLKPSERIERAKEILESKRWK